MRKFLLAAIALGAVAAAVPANAQQRCQEALNQWSSGAERFNSQAARSDARDEIDAAQREMRRGDDERCVMHVQRAMRIYDEDKRGGFARDNRGFDDRRYSDRSDPRFDDRDRTQGSGGGIGDILRGLGR